MARDRVRRITPLGTKWCSRCRKIKPEDQFVGAYCISCNREYHRSPDARSQRLDRTEKLKHEILSHYGGKCVHCGETDLDVLNILPRGRHGIRAYMYQLRREGYPPDRFVCCRNCELKYNSNT